MEDAPEAERICLGVTASEKMSVRCAVDLLVAEELGDQGVHTIINCVSGQVLFRLRSQQSYGEWAVLTLPLSPNQ
jgi:hypothetical protein